jgi:hypothetical protein
MAVQPKLGLLPERRPWAGRRNPSGFITSRKNLKSAVRGHRMFSSFATCSGATGERLEAVGYGRTNSPAIAVWARAFDRNKLGKKQRQYDQVIETN